MGWGGGGVLKGGDMKTLRRNKGERSLTRMSEFQMVIRLTKDGRATWDTTVVVVAAAAVCSLPAVGVVVSNVFIRVVSISLIC